MTVEMEDWEAVNQAESSWLQREEGHSALSGEGGEEVGSWGMVIVHSELEVLEEVEEC